MMADIYAYATQYTRQVLAGDKNPSRNMTNGKPYRTKVQREEARRTASKRSDGAWRSPAPVSFHAIARQSA